MPVPPKERWFDDYQPGEVFEFGQHLVTQDEIIEYARRYDPQPFHVDPVAARSSIYGDVIASGWMTAGVAMRMMCEHFIPPASSLGSPGIDHLRWVVPVRHGDRLSLRATVLEVRRSQTKPDRGVVTVRQELLNQHGAIVMSLDGKSMHRVRPST